MAILVSCEEPQCRNGQKSYLLSTCPTKENFNLMKAWVQHKKWTIFKMIIDMLVTVVFLHDKNKNTMSSGACWSKRTRWETFWVHWNNKTQTITLGVTWSSSGSKWESKWLMQGGFGWGITQTIPPTIWVVWLDLYQRQWSTQMSTK